MHHRALTLAAWLREVAILPLLSTAIVVGCKDATAPPESPKPVEIVYSLDRAGGAARDLFLIRPDGSSNQSYVSIAGDKVSPSWSPDGKALVFWLNGSDAGLWLAYGDGYDVRRVNVTNFGDPRWSPDGQWIIFVTDNTLGQMTIEAVRPDGSGRHTVAPGISDILETPPSWSRTGRLAFMRRSTGGNPGDGTIWSANVDGSNLVQLTSGRRDDRPHWSPDGSMLAYTAGGPTSTSSIYVFKAAVVNADGSGQRTLTDGSLDTFVEDWSPDGQWLLIRRVGVLDGGLYGCAYFKLAVSGGSPIRVSPTLSGASCGGASWR